MSVLRGGLRVLRAVLWVGLLGCCIAQAQNPAPDTPRVPAPQKLGPRDPNAPKEEGQFRIKNADRGRYDTKRGLFYLWGHVIFQDKDVTVECDEASFNEPDDTAACAGHIKMNDSESEITGELVNADFGAEIVNIMGNVKIVTTKSAKKEETAPGANTEGAKPEEKRVTTITCERIQYYYTEGKRHAVVTGLIKAVQKERTITAQHADYDRERDVITLGDDVTITREDGSEFHCTLARVGVSDDSIEMQNLSGKGIRKKKAESGKTAPAPAKPAG